MSKKVALIFGTRPEIIKLSVLIRLLGAKKKSYFVIHTGQHFSYDMDKLFFEELNLPEPHYKLNRKPGASGSHASETARMLTGIEKILTQEKPDVIVVQGDTNSVLAGALAAVKIPGIKIAHVEAGLRSYDRRMPEEINRVAADQVSDYLFCPTENSKKILLGEGISPKKIYVTGNTVVDAVFENVKMAESKIDLRKIIPSLEGEFNLLTLHRQENVDDRKTLSSIASGLEKIIQSLKMPIVFPIHPRTRKRLEEFQISLPDGVRAVDPVGFLEFLMLEKKAKLLLTDSGGVQEEGCILGVPCVTLRTSTERPETLSCGANVLAGSDPKQMLRMSRRMIGQKASWKNPFGDGKASQRIMNRICR